MNEPLVVIRLDRASRVYEPGDTLSCEFFVEGLHACMVKSVEVSVLWHTQGKGEEDLAVHQFHQFSAEESSCCDPLHPQQFRTVLPNSPMSYRGRIIDIRWCVRVRVFLHRGREVVGEQAFQLGAVPRAPAAVPATAAVSAT